MATYENTMTKEFGVEESVLYKVEDRMAWITINRPEKMNRLAFGTIWELVRTIERAGDDDRVRVLVITGAGGKAFCAGGGIDQITGSAAVTFKENLEALAQLFLVFRRIAKPSIAMIDGYAVGGGCSLAMAPTFGIASETAMFGYPEIKNGIWPMVVMPILVRTVGRKKGLELMSTGDLIDAREAERIGIINKVVPREGLKPHVVELANKLISKSGSILKFGLEVFHDAEDMDYEKALTYLKKMALVLSGCPDFVEGTSAFLEKREPNWND